MCSELTAFERKAIRMLIGGALGPTTVDKITHEARDIKPIFCRSGYVIETANSRLPNYNDQFDLPIVLGRYLDTEVRFTAKFEGQTLRLTCRVLTPGDTLNEEFRTQEVTMVSCGDDSANK